MDPHNSNEKKQVILVVLDGWGIAPNSNGNAIAIAKTPNMDRLRASFPHTQLSASGEAVGLPRGEVGNTETGHLNIGAGRIVYQDLARINISIADGSFYTNKTLLAVGQHVQKHNSALHLLGLVGAGGVHSNIEHLFALIRFAAQQKIPNVFLHLITDGRDSPPTSSRIYINQIRGIIQREQVGKFASIMGRYWAMDRDKRWDRTLKAYLALTQGQGQLYKTPEEAVEDSYKTGKTDEFIEPSLMMDPDGNPIALVKENDAVVFFNFRVDRPRQLSRAFVFNTEADIVGVDIVKDRSVMKRVVARPTFLRGEKISNLYFATMTEYERPLSYFGAHPIFPPIVVDNTLGAVISHNSMRQLRVSESEKERFVTYYFNGQKDTTFPGEEHLIVPSPRIPTYDQKPEMSAIEMTNSLLKHIVEGTYPFILINYANVDMVGHTGNLQAAIKAVEVVDQCIGKISAHVLAYGGYMVITADHGNAETMIGPTGEPFTEHTGNPVPFIVIGKDLQQNATTLPSGILGDIAPTILKLIDVPIPASMIGRNLLENLTLRY